MDWFIIRKPPAAARSMASASAMSAAATKTASATSSDSGLILVRNSADRLHPQNHHQKIESVRAGASGPQKPQEPPLKAQNTGATRHSRQITAVFSPLRATLCPCPLIPFSEYLLFAEARHLVSRLRLTYSGPENRAGSLQNARGFTNKP